MFVLIPLVVFLIFVAVLNIAIRKNDIAQQDVEQRFWDREQKANFTRRKDISSLDYLTIPIEKIPQNLHTEAENALVQLTECRMLNLTGLTNTDLKLEYGAANLEELSKYDDNFSEFVQNVTIYAKELLEADQKDDARALLELAVSYRADASIIYTMLADIYLEDGETGRIESLVQSAEEINSLSKNIIINRLNTYLAPEEASADEKTE